MPSDTGIAPGLLLVTFFLIAIAILVRFRPELGPAGPRLKFSERFRKSLGVYPVIGLFAVVLGGIYSGIFTPTESAAFGAFGAFLFALARGHMRSLHEIKAVWGEAVRTTAMIFAILFSGLVMAQFVNLTGLPFELVDIVTGDNAAISATALIIGICIICVIMGMIFEALGILLLVVRCSCHRWKRSMST